MINDIDNFFHVPAGHSYILLCEVSTQILLIIPKEN